MQFFRPEGLRPEGLKVFDLNLRPEGLRPEYFPWMKQAAVVSF